MSGLASMPVELFEHILAGLPMKRAVKLSKTVDAIPGIQDWGYVLSLKYPGTEWGVVSANDAILIDELLSPTVGKSYFVIMSLFKYGGWSPVKYLLDTNQVDPRVVFQAGVSRGDVGVLEYVSRRDDARLYPHFLDAVLRDAIRLGHLDVVTYLMTSFDGVDPADEHNEAIIAASNRGYLDIVKYLSSFPSVDPTARNNRAIVLAGRAGHLEVVKYLATLPGVNLCDQSVMAKLTRHETRHNRGVIDFLHSFC